MRITATNDGPVCRAPVTTVHLDPAGIVRACCENRNFILGDLRRESLAEVWAGEPFERLRAALAGGDFGLGCEGCRPSPSRPRSLTRAAMYDRYEASAAGSAAHPVRLELDITNRCNLQCIMCNGDLSSAIRTRREGRPPLPPVYGDRFFDEFRALVGNLAAVQIQGGEPFLGPESLRAMSILIEERFGGSTAITTNATVASDRVLDIIRRLRADLTLSVDSVDPDVLRAVRVGIEPSAFIANVHRLVTTAAEYGGSVVFNVCVMPQSAATVDAVFDLADHLGVDVNPIIVTYPPVASFRHCPLPVLDQAAERLRSTTRPMASRNLAAWTSAGAQLEAISIERHDAEPARPVALKPNGGDLRATHVLHLDGSGILRGVDGPQQELWGHDVAAHIGGPASALLREFVTWFGPLVSNDVEGVSPEEERRILRFGDPDRPTEMRAALRDRGPTEPHWVLTLTGQPSDR